MVVLLESDYYDRLSGQTRRSVKVRRSEFVGIAFPADDEPTFQTALESLRKEFFDATHHCWAFRVFDEGVVRDRNSDAGEPSGSAGRPILQALEAAGLIDSAVVVVRYFGGIKLGTGGLARAYRDAAREALENAPRERHYLYERLECAPGFEQMNQVYRLIDPPDVLLLEEMFDPHPRFVLNVRRSMAAVVEGALREQRIDVRRPGAKLKIEN